MNEHLQELELWATNERMPIMSTMHRETDPTNIDMPERKDFYSEQIVEHDATTWLEGFDATEDDVIEAQIDYIAENLSGIWKGDATYAMTDYMHEHWNACIAFVPRHRHYDWRNPSDDDLWAERDAEAWESVVSDLWDHRENVYRLDDDDRNFVAVLILTNVLSRGSVR